ncbi:uncharacterized protein [Primulina huaijiensis]|uniref:uncharacterized protein isoform X2 n=1 Tax=Primulina huaijiensis TaxID=1492673 RepID=UPI003CC75957
MSGGERRLCLVHSPQIPRRNFATMASMPCIHVCTSISKRPTSFLTDPHLLEPSNRLIKVLKRMSHASTSRKVISTIPRCSGSSESSGDKDESPNQNKTAFGYNRKDVLLIGLGATIAGVGLKSGLEFVGVDPLQAGNVVQLVLVLGLTVGWIFTYIFRVSNKEMTYAQQLRDYEVKVMEKRLESLTEAEIQALLEQVEEEKRRMAGGEQVNK